MESENIWMGGSLGNDFFKPPICFLEMFSCHQKKQCKTPAFSLLQDLPFDEAPTSKKPRINLFKRTKKIRPLEKSTSNDFFWTWTSKDFPKFPG